MTYHGHGRLGFCTAFWVWFSLLSPFSIGCLDDAKVEHEDDPRTGMDAGVPSASGDEDGGTSPSDDEDAATRDPIDEDDDSDSDDEPEADAGTADSDSDSESELVAGTAIEAGCSSAQPPADGMCGGYYCGVDADTLTAAFDPASRCGGDPAMACDGALTTAVAACARQVKAAMPFASNDALRPMIQACVYEDAELQAVPEDCLGCFLDVAACASDHCLFQCLAGDSEECDQCQLDNDCTVPVFDCGGLPNPF
jgi:hypothetical protein